MPRWLPRLLRRIHELMYVFKPSVAETLIYLKLVLRAECVVVSFHEDEDEGEGDADHS